jgi:hypothetical protein
MSTPSAALTPSSPRTSATFSQRADLSATARRFNGELSPLTSRFVRRNVQMEAEGLKQRSEAG